MFAIRSLALTALIACAAGAAQAGGSLSFNPAREWNGTDVVASDGIAEDTHLDTDVFQSTLLNPRTGANDFTPFDFSILAGAWTFTLGSTSLLNALIFDDSGGLNPASILVSIDNGAAVTASRVGAAGSNPGSYAVNFGSVEYSAGAHTMHVSGFGTQSPDTDFGPANFIDLTLVATDVPEPESCAMMWAGLAALGAMARRRQGSAGQRPTSPLAL